jgi:hypothetical protein
MTCFRATRAVALLAAVLSRGLLNAGVPPPFSDENVQILRAQIRSNFLIPEVRPPLNAQTHRQFEPAPVGGGDSSHARVAHRELGANKRRADGSALRD